MAFFGSNTSAHYLRSRMSRVCVAITGDTAAEMIEKADGVVRENPFVEFRLDYLEKPLAALPAIREFLYERGEVTAVATCRRVTGGGKFKGNAAAELEILSQAAASGFHLIDLEIETADAISRTQFEALRGAGAGLILSSHDFEGTKDLDKTFARLQAYSPDFYKIVSTAKNLSDNVEMKRFLERTSDSANVIGICMGEQGLISRVLGVRAGSVFTFASTGAGEETGPGQVSARTLLDTYRIDQIDTATKVYGVAGNPIRHSLSPVMMNSAFRRETVNGVFLALETRKLSDLLKLVHEVPIQGLAVTMPLKQEILPYLAKTDPISEKDRRLQHHRSLAGRPALRFQYRRRRHRSAAGTPPVAARRESAGAGRWRCSKSGCLRLSRKGSRSQHPEPDAGNCPETGAPGQGENHQAGTGSKDLFRRNPQCDPRRHDGSEAADDPEPGRTERAPGL